MSLIRVVIEGNKDATQLARLFHKKGWEMYPNQERYEQLPGFTATYTPGKNYFAISTFYLTEAFGYKEEETLPIIQKTAKNLRKESPDLPAFKIILIEDGDNFGEKDYNKIGIEPF